MPKTVAFCNNCRDTGGSAVLVARQRAGSGLGGNMFREPLRRDPLVVCWVLVILLAAFVALNNNTTWSGHLDPDRVAGFLKDLAEAFLWSFLLLLLLAWLRARGWRNTPSASGPRGKGKAA